MVDNSVCEFWRPGLCVLQIDSLTKHMALGLNSDRVLQNVLPSMTLGYIRYRCAQDHANYARIAHDWRIREIIIHKKYIP